MFVILQGPQKVKYGKVGFPDNIITAKNIIIATGSVPFVPKGIEVDGTFLVLNVELSGTSLENLPFFSGASRLESLNVCAGKTVITSDHALKLESVPDWIAIVGSGYIGLEFSDVYTALGSEVT